MAGLNFDITADNSNIKAKLEETQKKIGQMADYAEREGNNLDKTFSNIAKSIAAIGIGFSAQDLGRQILQVRGEFQQLEVAFETILGSEEKATELMSQMVRTAATTPFDLQSVASGAKQLLAYGENVENVNDNLIMLGNIAAGLSIPLGDLVYLYGTTMTQGRLYTEDFNQFVGRGIPLVKELSKEFGVAESEVKGLVEAGRVGFPEIQKVLQNLTSEGGMFYNLMAEQSKTISGQISNIGDSFSMMLNDIGKANEGVINDALGGVSYLLENYEAIGKTILELVSAYGAYKAILITLTALQKAYGVVMQQAALEQSLAAAAGTTLSASQAKVAASTKLLNLSFKSLNATIMANPFAAVTAAVVALGYGIYKLSTYQTDYEKGLESLGNSYKEYNEQASSEQRQLAGLYGQLSALKKGTSEYNDVKEQIIKGYSKYYSGLTDEIEAVGLTEEAYRKLTQAIDQSFGARQYKKFSEEQMGLLDETTAENLEKIQNRLVDKLGDEAGNRYYAKIREAIFTGSVKNINGTSNLVGLDKETKDALKKVSDVGFGISNTAVEQYIANILNAQKVTEELDKQAKIRFGISDTKVLPDSTETVEEAKRTNKSLSEIIASIKEAEQNIKSLREQSAKGLISTADVESAIAELDTLKKKYKTMTGKEYGDTKAQEQALKEQESLNKELLDLQKKGEDDKIAIEKEGTERQLAEIKLRYERELQTIEQLEEKLKKAQGGTLTSDQQSIINNAKNITEQKYKSETSKVTNEELEKERKALQDFYIQYGEYWEKRKNLAAKYQDEIAKATSEGEKKSLQKELENSIKELEFENFKSSINFDEVFGDIDTSSTKTLSELKDKLSDYIQEAANKLSPENLKVLKDAFVGIDEELLRRNPFEGLKERVEEMRLAAQELEKAKDNLERVQSGEKVVSGYSSVTNEQGQVVKIEKTYLSAGQALEKYNKAKENSEKASRNVIKAEKETISQVDSLASAIKGIGSTIGGEAGEIITLIGNITSFTTSAISGISSVMQTGANAMSAMEKASVILGVISTAVQIFQSIGDMFGGDTGTSDYEVMIEKYQTLSSLWDDLISKKMEYISIDYGDEASKAAEEAKKLLESQILLARQAMEEAAKEKGNYEDWLTGYGKLNTGIKVYNKINNTGINSIDELVQASPEKMKELLQDTQFVELIASNNTELLKYMQTLAGYSDQLDEIAEKEDAAITGVSFSNFRDSYKDLLTDLDSTNEDFAKSFEQKLQEALLNSLMADKYNDKIKKLYDSWTELGKDGLTKDEIEQLKKQEAEITEQMINDRNNLKELFGWSSVDDVSTQEATAGGFETMSQDTADELNGRFTAMYEVDLGIRESVLSIVASISVMSVSASERNVILSEIRNLMITNNNYLDDISVLTKKIHTLLTEKLASIDANIKNVL